MAEYGQTDDVLKKCIEEVLSVIKPANKDESLRYEAIKELTDSISSAETLTGVVVKPYGSFLSNLYAVSGDLDISIELQHNSQLRTTREKEDKIAVLEEVKKALETEGIPRDVELVSEARVPVLKYVSKKVRIPCDVSVENYPGLIKSRVLYWINKLDMRFGDMVLLVKEWAKSQKINNPKSGTLSSYSLSLLVIYHFQTCEPEILPPLKEIYDLNSEGTVAYCEKDLDNMCEANIETFQSKNSNQRNESSLSHLFATFFQKFSFGNPSDAISTFEGKLKKNKNILYSPGKSKSPLLVYDPFERPGNAARTVSVDMIERITSAFSRAKSAFVLDGRLADRNELLSLMCTPEVGKTLGVAAVAHHDTSSVMDQFLQSIPKQKLVEEKDHIHHDMAPLLRFLHIPEEVAADDE